MDESLETVKKEANKHELKKSVEEKIQQMEKLLQSKGLSLLEELKEEAKQFGEYLKFRDHTEQRERDEAKIQEQRRHWLAVHKNVRLFGKSQRSLKRIKMSG